MTKFAKTKRKAIATNFPFVCLQRAPLTLLIYNTNSNLNTIPLQFYFSASDTGLVQDIFMLALETFTRYILEICS